MKKRFNPRLTAAGAPSGAVGLSPSVCVLLLSLVAPVSACSGPFSNLFERDTEVVNRRDPIDVGPAVRALGAWAEPDRVQRGFDQAASHLANERLTEVQRDRLLRARAEALLALVVLADVQTDLDPMKADALFVIVGSEVAGYDGAEPVAETIVADVLAGLQAGGVSDTDREFARIVLDTALQSAEDETWYTASLRESMWGGHARLLALARVMRRFGAWSRRGTGSGGDVLMRDCGFLCDAADVPPTIEERAAAAGFGCAPDAEPIATVELASEWALPQEGAESWDTLVRCGPAEQLLPATPQSPSLVSDANYLDAVLLTRLADLIRAIEADGATEDALVNAAADWFSWVHTQLGSLAVPAVITPNALTLDVRLDLPRSFEADVGDAWDLLVQPPRLRMLFIRTDGVYVSIRPHLALREVGGSTAPELVWAEGDAGWHLPGALAVPFLGPGAIGPDELVDGVVPALRERLTELESSIADWAWVPPEERGVERSLSVMADGDIYFSTMEPLLRTASETGIQRLVLHTWSPALNRLSALPVRVRAAEDEVGLTVLRIREDGYSLVQNEQPVLTVSRVQPDAFIRLYRAAVALDSAALEDELLVSVEDGSADWGGIMNVANALSYLREFPEDAEATSDRALLQASPLLSGAGPVPLFARGIVLTGPI